MRLLAATGLDGADRADFRCGFGEALTAEEFVRRILVERFAVSGAAIGFNFHFGANRAGSPDFLAAEGKKCGFAVDVVPRFEDGGRPVSSGPIRDALAAGRLDLAAEFLGYPWFVSGTVIHGDKRGRELGFPTANLQLDAGCGLRHGIYAVRVAVGGRRYDGVASFGRRPMFDNGTVLLEVFVFDFSGDLYGGSIDVAFIAWLRDEQNFASAEDSGAADAGGQPRRRESRWRAPATCFRRFNSAAVDQRCQETRLRMLVRVAMFAGPLRHHEADERDRHDALPAERAAGLDGGAEDPRIEQPGRRVCLCRAGENGALS